MNFEAFHEAVEGQFRNISQENIPNATEIELEWLKSRPITGNEAARIHGWEELRVRCPEAHFPHSIYLLLVVHAPRLRDPTKGDWFYPGNMLSREKYEFDGIIVSYGEASDGGEIWYESQGRDRKSSYRRLDYMSNVQVNKYHYCREIKYTASEENILRFLTGNPELTSISDFASGK